MISNDLKPGDMVLWQSLSDVGDADDDCHNGKQDTHIGILVRRFDNYVENKIASRNYSPSWCWKIKFTTAEPPYNYNPKYGASECNLKNGVHGKIIRAHRER